MTDKTDNTTEHPEVRFIPPSYRLKAKAPLTGEDLGTVLARAEISLNRHHDEFLGKLKSGMASLQQAFDALLQAGGDETAVKKLDDEAHDLRGLCGTFGYRTVTDVCAILCAFLENRTTLSASEIEVVRLHINAAALAAARQLDGSTAEGKLVLDGLRRVVAGGTPPQGTPLNGA